MLDDLERNHRFIHVELLVELRRRRRWKEEDQTATA